MKTTGKLWLWIAVLAILTPLGIIIPKYFRSAGAFGEQKISGLWNAPMPDYAFKGWEEKGLPHLSLAYIISALAGIAVIVVLVMAIGKFLSKKGE
jgi:cobalt/nickel transport protein